jgi:hypothetical protein
MRRRLSCTMRVRGGRPCDQYARYVVAYSADDTGRELACKQHLAQAIDAVLTRPDLKHRQWAVRIQRLPRPKS